MWIGAHPDDENAAGGLLVRARDRAGTLYLASFTRGENPPQTWGGLRRGSEIAQAREALLSEAAGILLANDWSVGPFVNGPHTLAELDAMPPDAPFEGWPPDASSADVLAKWAGEGDPVGFVVGLLRTWRPHVVVTLDGYCGVSGHPEHRAVGRTVEAAIPLAADPARYPVLGEPWSVPFLVLTGRISDDLTACGLCKCEGDPPPEPIEHVLALDTSATHGGTYYYTACLVQANYANTMQELGLTPQEREAACASNESMLQQSYQQGNTQDPITEPYRLRVVATPVPAGRGGGWLWASAMIVVLFWLFGYRSGAPRRLA